jgi:capsular exopolysaccharide synthesis family protein
MEFWRYFRIVNKRRWLILTLVIVAFSTVAVLAQPGANDYEATATLTPAPDDRRFVSIGRFQDGILTPDAQATLAMDLIRSRTVAERAAQQIQPTIPPAELQLRTRVTQDRMSDLLRLTVTGRDPQQAVQLTNTVAQVAAAYHQEIMRRQVTLNREFIEKQFEETRENLRRAEEALTNFRKNRATTGGALPNELARVAGLQGEVQRIDLELGDVDVRLGVINKQLTGQRSVRTSREISSNPIAQILRQQLIEIEVQLTTALATMTDKHPAILSLTTRRDAIKERLNQELTKVVSSEIEQTNPIHEALTQTKINLETVKMAMQARREAIQRIVGNAKSKMPAMFTQELEETRLARGAALLGQEFSSLQARLSDARIREQEWQNRGTLTIIDFAKTARPSPFLQRQFKLTVATLGSFLLGLVLAFLLEYLDTSIKSPDQAERILGVPALATIPRHVPPFSEAYRLLRVNLAALLDRNRTGTVLFTSPNPGNGTSTVTSNLAQAFAEAGYRTVLVDASVRRPVQHVRFGLTWTNGLTEVLEGKAKLSDALLKTGVQNLWLLPSGNTPADPSGLMGSEAMASVLSELEAKADLILIDASAAGPFADALSLAPLSDGVVLVLAAGQKREGLEEYVKTQLERLGAKILGIVLNKIPPENAEHYALHERFYERKIGGPVPLRKKAAAAALSLYLLVGVASVLGVRLDAVARIPATIGQSVSQWASIVPGPWRSAKP